MTSGQTSKIRRFAGNILIVLGVLVLGASAGAKFAHVPKVAEELSRYGFDGGKLQAIAGLEALSALLFVIPSTRSLGLLLVSSYLGGAIATHVQHNHSLVVPSVILALIWLGAWLRHPGILESFGREEISRAPGIEGGLKASVNTR